jgi:hypothetical protein
LQEGVGHPLSYPSEFSKKLFNARENADRRLSVAYPALIRHLSGTYPADNEYQF